MRSLDPLALSARLLPLPDLVRAVLGARCNDDDVSAIVRALGLWGGARTAALQDVPAGARIVAAIELARRVVEGPPGSARRIEGPHDVAQVVRALARDDAPALFVLAVDARLRLCRVTEVATAMAAGSLAEGGAGTTTWSPADVLTPVLHANARHFVIAHRAVGRALPRSADVDASEALGRMAAAMGLLLLDHVVLGDDGIASLVRLGLLPSRDRRFSAAHAPAA